jgi:hypothetical protein
MTAALVTRRRLTASTASHPLGYMVADVEGRK